MIRLPLFIRASRVRGALEFGNVLVVVLVGCGVIAWCWHMRAKTPAPRTEPSLAAGTTMGPLEPNTIRLGRDLSDAGTRTETAADCAHLCLLTEACRAMSFSAETGDRGHRHLLAEGLRAGAGREQFDGLGAEAAIGTPGHNAFSKRAPIVHAKNTSARVFRSGTPSSVRAVDAVAADAADVDLQPAAILAADAVGARDRNEKAGKPVLN